MHLPHRHRLNHLLSLVQSLFAEEIQLLAQMISYLEPFLMLQTFHRPDPLHHYKHCLILVPCREGYLKNYLG